MKTWQQDFADMVETLKANRRAQAAPQPAAPTLSADEMRAKAAEARARAEAITVSENDLWSDDYGVWRRAQDRADAKRALLADAEHWERKALEGGAA